MLALAGRPPAHEPMPKHLPPFLLALAALSVATLSALPRAQDDDEPVRDGKWLYTRHCAGCHNDNGDGKGATIVQMGLVARDFAQGGFAFGDSREQMKRTITSGIPGRSPMPSFKGVLEDEEMDLVIEHVRTLMPKRDEARPRNTEMIVKERPLVARGKLPPIAEGAKETPRGLLIGTPEGMTFEYDLADVRLLGVRLGRFADREDWGDRGGAYLKPLGKLVWDAVDGLDVRVRPRPESSYLPMGGQKRVLRATFALPDVAGLEYDVRDQDGKGRVLATVREEVRTRTTTLGAALERSWQAQPGSLMEVALAFRLPSAQESEGSAVRWVSLKRGEGEFDVTAVRRGAVRPGVERTSAISIRVPAWNPELAAQLEKELGL